MLVQDNWDDYGYKTTFHVTLHMSADESYDLGSIKIIEAGRTSGYTEMPRQPFAELPPVMLRWVQTSIIMRRSTSSGETSSSPIFEVFEMSRLTMRSRPASKTAKPIGFRCYALAAPSGRLLTPQRLLRAPTLPTKRRSAGFRVKFKTQVARRSNAFTIDFDFRRRGRLPNRINALIGYNGTGKTRLLSNLAIVASGYGYGSKEDVLDDAAGRFVGTAPPFKTVVVVSYSAFDTFVIPGRTEEEKERLQERGEIFGYVYCGLRERSDDDAPNGEQAYRLRTPAEIEAEFLSALGARPRSRPLGEPAGGLEAAPARPIVSAHRIDPALRQSRR